MRESTMWATNGGPIIGEIKNGKKYPFGTVSATQYEEDMATLNTEISGLNSAVVACQGTLSGLQSALDTLSGQYGATVPGLSQAVSDIRVQVGEVNAALTAAVASLTASINTVDAKTGSIEASYGTRLTAAENGLTRVSAESAQNAQDIAAQATTIGTLSNDLGAVTDLATGTAATAAANSEAITGIRDAITQMRASITANADAINAFNAAITELTSTQNVDRATLTARIAAAENSVTALSQTVEGYNTSLSNQIAALRASVTASAQDIAVIQNTLQIQGAAVESVDNRCSAVENRMNSQEVGMATLRQQLLNSVMNIENEIEQIVTDKAAIKADLTALTQAVNAYEADTAITLRELNNRVSALEDSIPLEILNFRATPDVCEIGGSENVILSWNIQGTIAQITLDGQDVTGETQATKANVRENTSYLLNVADRRGNTARATASVKFVNHVFWGTSASAEATEATLKGLDHTELSDVRARTFNVSPDFEYIYYGYPKRLGTSEFKVNDFVGGFEDPEIVSVDNHAGFHEDYYIYRSANKLNSSFEVHVI